MVNVNSFHKRSSFLASYEQRAVRWLIIRLPDKMNSLHLTAIGMTGAVICIIGLVGCHWSSWWLAFVWLGISLNWFGDLLAGSLARNRQSERPRFGFHVDHTCDLFAQVLIILAFGLSPFFSLVSAFVVL
ncbi:MAG: CDP-alcohol phosphatidyltransferase, partial [Hyphomicrobiales bacterium]|nr:CDP-alcohol phosphatidyltransferase [Hyphomicrobiales bacterium]